MPRRSKPATAEEINDLLDQVTDHAKHVTLGELPNISDGKVYDAIMALKKLEDTLTRMAFEPSQIDDQEVNAGDQ